jgi:hypothetical protein
VHDLGFVLRLVFPLLIRLVFSLDSKMRITAPALLVWVAWLVTGARSDSRSSNLAFYPSVQAIDKRIGINSR